MKNFITVLNLDQDIEIKEEVCVLDLLLENNVDIDHSCGGMGSCGTCRVLVHSRIEDLPPRNEIEQERADDLNFGPQERLACQLCPFHGLKIKTP